MMAKKVNPPQPEGKTTGYPVYGKQAVPLQEAANRAAAKDYLPNNFGTNGQSPVEQIRGQKS